MKHFGSITTGEDIFLYKISSERASAEIITFGAILKDLSVFGKSVVGGFNTLEDYIADTSHQGGTIGRVANRIENATFTIDGEVYSVPKNNNGNCLHGGIGFDRRVWSVKEHCENSITLCYTALDGEEGFPGELNTEVRYTISGTSLMIEYKASADKKTPIALTNHSYFNLDGFGGDVKNQYIKIYADSYTDVDSRLIPNGKHPDVTGTPFDLRNRVMIGKNFESGFNGYDHNFITTPAEYRIFNGKNLGLIAEADNEKIKMSVYTDQPGVQFYTANFLTSGPSFKGGFAPLKHGAFCLETQTEPNCINHGIGIYSAEELYMHTTVYNFEKIGGQ